MPTGVSKVMQQSVPLDANSALDTWSEAECNRHLWCFYRLGSGRCVLDTPDGSITGNAYFDSVVFGEYSN